MRLLVTTGAICCCLLLNVFAADLCQEVVFTGTISSVFLTGDDQATVFVRTGGVDLRIVVSSDTIIGDNGGSDLEVVSLRASDIVRIRGNVTPAGIDAREIEVVDAVNRDFCLRGPIENIVNVNGNLVITMHTLSVVVSPDARIRAEGATVPAAELQAGMLVELMGTISGRRFTADSVSLISDQIRQDRIRFSGVVRQIRTEPVMSPPLFPGIQMLSVELEDIGGIVVVRMSPNTDFLGEVAIGQRVVIEGTLNSDLSITALVVHAIQEMEIRPASAKLQVGESATFIVKFRESVSAETSVSLQTSNDQVANLPVQIIKIARGHKIGQFVVKGASIGSAVITAKSGDLTATSNVTVGQISTADNEKPNVQGCEVRVKFAPDHIKLRPGESREVVLIIQPPQKTEVNVAFNSSNSSVATVPSSRHFNNGAAELKVLIQAGTTEGTASIVATVPAPLCGSAELLVEVSSKPGGGSGGTGGSGNQAETATIKIEPGDLELKVDQTRVVNLIMSNSFNTDTTVTIANADPTKATAPATVTIPAGDKHVQFSITGKSVGDTTIVASLPANRGGDTARVTVHVRKVGK